MKYRVIFFWLLTGIAMYSCGKKVYATNGETIYRTGRNLEGVTMLDRKASRIPFVKSCQACHGKNGDRMNSVSLRFSYLSNSNHFSVPYNDTLLFRFLDKDLKSNGTKANIGVIWKMSDKDKQDLLDYLKKL